MNIWGFDRNLDQFKVKLSPAEVVSLGIDPWRVDLLDTDPVEREVGGRRLYFTRLRKCSFAYVEDGMTSIGVYDGNTSMCVCGPSPPRTPRPFPDMRPFNPEVKLSNSKIADFKSCFRQFLSSSSTDNRSSRFHWLHDGNNLSIKDGLVSYSTFGSRTVSRGYCDRMLEQIALKIALPEAINWVFEAFAEWHPRVVGDCFSKVIWNQELKEVTFLVEDNLIVGWDNAYWDSERQQLVSSKGRSSGRKWEDCVLGFDAKPLLPSERLGPLSPEGFEFEFHGVRYRVTSRPTNPSFWHREFTVNDVYAESSNHIVASRMALFDLAFGRVRELSDVGALRPGFDATGCTLILVPRDEIARSNCVKLLSILESHRHLPKPSGKRTVTGRGKHVPKSRRPIIQNRMPDSQATVLPREIKCILARRARR